MQRLPGLDLLRAIAIVWVMLFHSFVVGGLGEHWEWLSRYGWMGVDLFFVLSGFLIGSQVLGPLSRGEPLGFGTFYLRRSLRVLPAFFVVLALYRFWPAFRESPGLEPAWKFLTFSLNLLIDYGANRAFSHAWSLCVEEHFYLLFPFAAWAMLQRPSARRFVAVVAALVIAGIALRAAVWLWDLAPALDMEGDGRSFGQRFVEDMYYPTWNRLDGLLAGVALATLKIWRPAAWARLQSRGDALLLAGVATVGLAMWLFRERTGLTGNTVGWPVLSAGMALLVAAGAGPGSWIGRHRVPGAGWLAAASYSLYLIHKGAFHLVDLAWGPQLAGRGVVAFAVFAAATLAAGALLYYGIERPFLRLRDRWVAARTASATAAMPAEAPLTAGAGGPAVR